MPKKLVKPKVKKAKEITLEQATELGFSSSTKGYFKQINNRKYYAATESSGRIIGVNCIG